MQTENELKNIEINQIVNILTDITTNIKFDDKFSFINMNISYELGHDSKIISKIYECVIIDKLKKILISNQLEFIENNIQNKYPDFIIQSKINKEKYYAIDIKSSYLKTPSQINGFTLGTYKGYFKNRDTLNSIVKPYNSFIKHYCLCVIYDRCKDRIPVKYIFVREKWEIAYNNTGSGNTCNIGSIKLLDNLINKKYYFNNEEEFNKYWLNYK